MTDLADKVRAAADAIEAQEGMPKFNSMGLFITGRTVTSDCDGNLWLIDANAGSIKRVEKL